MVKQCDRLPISVLNTIVLLFSLIVICTMVLFSPHSLIYDEVYHLEGAKLLVEGSSMLDLLKAPLPSAPGPLYPAIQAVFAPLTGLQVPQIRLLNLFLLLLSILALSTCLHQCKFTQPVYRASSILAIPIFWVVGGIALTEVPAFLMATISCLTASFAIKNSTTSKMRYIFFLLLGFFAGLSILGRQTYFPLIFIFVVIAFSRRYLLFPAISAFLTAFLIPLPVFLIWGGLVPDSQSGISFLTVDNIKHGFLAFAYLGSVIVILAPSFFLILLNDWKKWLIVSCSLAIINVLVFKFKFSSFASLAKYFPSSRENYELLVGTVLIVLFFILITSTTLNLIHKYEDKLFVIMLVSTIVATSTCFGIGHQFSSRYLMTSFPFVVLMIQPFYSPSLWSTLRFLLGAILGVASLASYYQWI